MIAAAVIGHPAWAAPGDADNGARIFRQLCTGCHGEDGRGGGHTFMPHIHNLTKRNYIEKVPDDFLFLVISKGGAAVGKHAYMPAWESRLAPQEIWDVVAHIRTLPTY